MRNFIPVILSGGSGTRMWPYSRSAFPKQLLPLVSDNSMLQDTALRFKDLENCGSPIVVCNEEHRFLVAQQLHELGYSDATVLLEPAGRNTAPAIALAALSAQEDDVLAVLPADHIISAVDSFHIALEQATSLAADGKLVTFGIVPNEPHIGYGYIKAGAQHQENAFEVAKFVEKPNLQTAQSYLDIGGYSWNSGMFVFTAGAFLKELKQYQPEIYHHCVKSHELAKRDLDFIRIDKSEFVQCPDISVDYAVMEKTSNAVVIPIDVGWNDVGSWSALWEVSSKDEHGNTVRGDVINHSTKNSFIQSDEKLIATLGIENTVVIETDDAILVADRARVQEVKNIVKQLREMDRPEAAIHRKVYRPWGYYDSIENGHNYQVKRLAVYPGAKLSLQKHRHRAEHWIVVSGIADVVNGDNSFQLQANESTYIPIGAVHQLGNSGDQLLEIIEVQSGSYLGEDDIERLEDVYGRIEK